jgi:hypothetical protein
MVMESKQEFPVIEIGQLFVDPVYTHELCVSLEFGQDRDNRVGEVVVEGEQSWHATLLFLVLCGRSEVL